MRNFISDPLRKMACLMCVLGGIALFGPTSLDASPAARKKKSSARKPSSRDPFAGLPPMKATGKEAFFNFRPGPKPPGNIGTHIKLSFPPPASTQALNAPKVEHPPLHVIHVRPKGEVSLIGAVTVTFNQPMIPLSSVGESKLEKIPFQLHPQPKGRYRWLGTKTVSFEPKDRMPYSTKYDVIVPKGTRSVHGKELAQDLKFSFTTPTLKLTRHYPQTYNPERPDTWVAMEFNQPFDRDSVLKNLRIESSSGEIAYDVWPQSEWAKNKRQYPNVRSWRADRMLILKPRAALPRDSNFNVTINSGAKGEGPIATTKTLQWKFRTYGPMKVKDGRCNWRKRFFLGLVTRCNPNTNIWVSFTNPVGPGEIEKYIETTPSFKDLRLQVYGSYIYLSRPEGWPPASDLRITVKAGLKDIYGQTLKDKYSMSVRFLDATPFLQLPRWQAATLEQHENHEFYVQMRNITTLRTRMLRVSPREIYTYNTMASQLGGYQYRNKEPFDGIKLDVDEEKKTRIPKNKSVEWRVSLKKALNKKPGAVIVALTSEQLRTNRWSSPHRGLLVLVTDIGLTVRYGISTVAVLATSLRTGKPLPNAKLELFSFDGSHRSLWKGSLDKGGYAAVPGSSRLSQRGPYILVATQGDDFSYVLLTGSGESGYTYGYSRYSRIPKRLESAYYVFTERSPYKPGELVHIRGVLRQREARPLGGVLGLPGKKGTVNYVIRSPRWQIVKKGKMPLQAGHSFSLDFQLKELADLGNYRIEGDVLMRGERYRFYGNFQVQAYRAPEYTVKVNVPKGPFFFTQKVKATIEGRYTFGAPMAKAPVTWTLRRALGYYTPPNQPPGFRFGLQAPWHWNWRSRYSYRGGRYGRSYRSGIANAPLASGKGELDKQGHLSVPIALAPGKLKSLGNFTFEAQVYDKNRQSIAGRARLLAHASSVYIGLRSKKPVIKAKQKADIEALAVSIDGKRQSGVAIELTVLQNRTKRKPVKRHGEWTFTYESKEVKVAGCTMQSTQDIVRCSIEVPQAGYYTLQATAKDALGRATKTRMGIYAYGKSYVPWKTNNPERLELIVDQKEYKPGQTARILVKSPFRKAHGILTLERNGIAEHKPIFLSGSAQAIAVKIRREYMPNLYVAVSLARGRIPASALGITGSGADDLGRPAYAFGQVKLNVSLTEKELRVAVLPSKEKIRPGDTLRLTLKTTDYRGRPARGLVTVALVDEGVLSLLGFQTPSPLRVFHSERPSWAVLKDLRVSLLRRKKKKPKRAAFNRRPSRQRVVVTRNLMRLNGAANSRRGRRVSSDPAPPSPAAPMPQSAPGARFLARTASVAERSKSMDNEATTTGTSTTPTIRVRSNFATTAYYQAIAKTDANGIANLRIKMPDNLTTFRIMAVVLDAKESDRFGNGEGRVTVRKPLLLRPALPRFANFGDRFEASVVINNETGKDGTVDVFARGVNVELTGESRQQVQIPAGEAREVRFPVRVQKPGIARFQFAAVLEKEADAVEKSIPILIPATAEAFATYGTTTNSVAQPIQAPQNALSAFGGLKISFSSTALNGLEDAVRYLVEYPFECTEQTASRAMPIFALRKILPAFKIGKVKDQATMKKFANHAIAKLLNKQRYDGGWGYWSGSRYSYMWLSSYVTYALLRAKEAGYKVDASKLYRAAQFLRNRLRWSPFEWERKNPSVRTIATWVLSEIKPNLQIYLNELYGKRKELPLFAKAWLMVAMHRHNKLDGRIKELQRVLNNSAIQLPGRVHFSERKTESLRMLMHSEDRTDAIVLRALLEVNPRYALIPKIARGLMRSRIRGRWATTQSNAYAMLALSRYFDIYEKTVPHFTLHNWLGNGYLGKAQMKGRSLAIYDQHIPMSFLQKHTQKPTNLVLAKRGKGRLYYRLGVRYAPKSLELPAEEQGFSVNRQYEPVGHKDDVVRLKDGRWQFKAGTYVRVRLRIVSPGYRYFVAVVDPLPAGLEAVNLAFKTSASSALAGQQTRTVYDSYSWYSFFAFNHHEKRDSMVVLFANRLPAGVYEYTYVARATTIGQFVIPPARAEEMYSPEVFGRNQTMFGEVLKP